MRRHPEVVVVTLIAVFALFLGYLVYTGLTSPGNVPYCEGPNRVYPGEGVVANDPRCKEDPR